MCISKAQTHASAQAYHHHRPKQVTTKNIIEMTPTTIDPRTNRQRRYEQRRAEISERYAKLRSIYPNVSDNHIYSIIAQERDMTTNGVRRICIDGQQTDH